MVDLENWLTDQERIRLFLDALERIATQEPSIDPAVLRRLRTLVSTS
jgi:hypothetical protein